MSWVTQNVFIFHIYLCPKRVTVFLTPSTARTGIAGQWGGAVPRSLSKAEAPEPICSCAWQCLLKVEALLQRDLFWAVGFLLVWCFVWFFCGFAIVATQENCISESQTVSESTWPSEPYPGAGSPSVGAGRALRPAPPQPTSGVRAAAPAAPAEP